ncbi:MAG TPA: hypothetical protein VMH50_15055 [Thermoleophilia bacterium]|nr:hypothetical protein [Thermoleophilia bacterium]
MSARAGIGRGRRARPPACILLAPALAAVFVLAAIALSACGGVTSSNQIAGYLGVWQRVVGGEPDSRLTLVVERQGDAARATFSDLQTGSAAGGVTTPGDDYLSLELPAGNSLLDATGLQLSLDDNGELVVDKVLSDGTTEPVWIYARAASPVATSAP